ncbi:hypothetical protein T07_12291, partial [Trichinella nelsoni]
LNRLSAEFEELCLRSADAFEVEEQAIPSACKNGRGAQRTLFWRDSSSSGRPAVRAGNGRLPEVTLPKFSGKLLEFPSVLAQFAASKHRRSKLDNATKFTYLTSSTAVDVVKTRFGQPRLVIREQLAALWRAPACREITAHGIQSLVDEVTKHLRYLTTLDRNPFTSRLSVSEALMLMLHDNFAPALIRAWHTNIGLDAEEDEDNLWKFLEFA